MASLSEHEPHGTHQTKKATTSGWIGSALEYHDFFIYATAGMRAQAPSGSGAAKAPA